MLSRRLVPGFLLPLVGSSLAAIASPAVADVDLVGALDLPTGVSASVTGSNAAASTSFNDFPSQGADYLILSSGNAADVFGAPADAQLSTDFGGDGQPDNSTLTLSVAQGTPNAGCLFMDFALGTEEPVHTYVESAPGDALSIKRAAAPDTEYAVNAGRGYFAQGGWPAQPKPYQVNALGYWHDPGDPGDPVPGGTEDPWLHRVTGLNHVTSRDTARVPLDLTGGSETITVRVADAVNGDLDSVAFIDDVRLGPTCDAGTGVEPNPVHNGGVIRGIRGIGNTLTYDPIPSTDGIERYDDPGNGWRSPSNVPVELRFRWYRTLSGNALNGDMSRWTPIQDADRQSYVPTAADRGYVLIVMVTGFVDGRRPETFPRTGSTAPPEWYVTTPIDDGTFIDGEAPVIVGSTDPESGSTLLTANTGHTKPQEDTWTFQWFASGQSISGATGKTFRPGAAQAGKMITVRATAKRLNFDDKTWESAPYGPIPYQTWDSSPNPQIVVDGIPEYGATLAVDTGTWAPTPDSYSYQWRSNGKVITGATHATYTIKADDVGAQLTVTVAAVKTGFQQVPRESAPVEVLGATMTGATPAVTGTAKVGQRLTGSVTGWQPTGSILTYAWYAGGDMLQEGSSQYLTVPAAAAGKAIVLKVTGRKPGYSPLTVASTPTALVQAGTLTAAVPRIFGYAKVGQTLTASPGYWGPTGVRLSYRWRIGSTPVTGPAGARSTFKIPRKARGKRITVVVTGRLAGYTTVAKRSAATAKVVR